MRPHSSLRFLLPLLGAVALAVCAPPGTPPQAAEPAKLSILLLGDDGHHRPADFAKVLTPAFGKVGIDVTYTEEVKDLVPARLAKYDTVAIFRDGGDLPSEQEAALLDFVEGGKGLVAIHCASHCFRNSAKYGALVGGRFKSHETGTFRGRIIDAQHPALKDVKSFETWDETYVHNELGDDLRVLMVREDKGGYEPYTWVCEQGKGRVFYTAFGHDERTWKNEGFQKLLESGTRWAAGQTAGPDKDVKPFEYVEANVPNYVPGEKWGMMGEPIKKMQKPLDPAESMKHMHLPEGFEVQLFAADPDVAKPIAMAWDARGRLWIAETVDYPNEMQKPGEGHDRIKILEDTHGDGKADKVTIFADKLSIPTSLTFANGGVVVTQAPDTLFLKSSKDDDKADIRQVLFSGWGTQDTHAGPSNLRPGFDNWIWGTVGYSGFSGKVGDKAQKFGQGIFHFKPDGSQMEFLTSTSNNTWGLGLSEKGEVFASTANNQHSVHLAIPNGLFEGVRGWHGHGSEGIEDHKKFHPVTKDVRQVDWHGGYTAACGHALYTARAFPPEYWDRAAFVCEPTGHLVHVDWLTPQGSAYVARDGWNILASDDAWTAPVAAEVGPDGALWVIDWYNYIVQHNPTPTGFKTGKGGAYETPLRDKTHGRIYRIVYKGAKAAPKPNLDRAEPKELVATLGNDNLWQRQTAQRLLVERGKSDIVPLLAAQVRDPKSGPAALHALWTMHGLGAFSAAGKNEQQDSVRAGLAHPDPAVRRAALAVAPRTAESVADILAAKSLSDDDAQVRLEALLALSEMPGSKEAAAALVAMLQEPRNSTDHWIPTAAVGAAARSDLDFLQAAAAARPKGEGEKALTEAVRVVAGHTARQASSEAPGRVLAALGTAQPAVAEALLNGLATNWPADKPAKLDATAEADLKKLSGKLSPAALLQFAALARRWGQQDKLGDVTAGVKRALLDRLADAKLADDDRAAAARDLLTLGEQDAVPALLEQITPQTPPALTRAFLDAVGQATSDDVGAALVKRWRELTPAVRPAVLGVLLRRPAWTKALLTGLEEGKIEATDLGVEQAQMLRKHPDPAIAEAAAKLLAKSGAALNPDRVKVVEAKMPLVKKSGDKARGKVVFENNCAKCHRHGSVGASIGPDLTGVAVRDRADILIDILDPNRSVEGNYRQYTVETRQGQYITGLLAAETKTAVEILDSEAKKHVVLREDVERIISSKLSLMPEGFEGKIPDDDLVCLLDFLSARDKYLALPLGKAATITSVRGMFVSRDADAERLIFPTWGAQTFEGVPFQVIDPRDGSIPNVILLNGPGAVCKEMPKSATVPCNAPVKTIHLLSGVGGWCYPFGEKGAVVMIVRLHYADGKTEDHPLLNGVHFADYIRVVDVPESKMAFKLRGQQIRYLAVTPKRADKIESIEFVKGDETAAPVVMAVTVEAREQ